MSLGILFAKRDGPVNAKAFDLYTNCTGVISAAFFILIFGVFFMGQLNLFLGLESQEVVTVESMGIPDRQNHAREVVFQRANDKKFEQKISAHYLTKMALVEGKELEVKIDGLFWSKIVAAKLKSKDDEKEKNEYFRVY